MQILYSEMKDLFRGEEPVISASVRVTKGCNLRCRHCYAEGGIRLKSELSLEEINTVLHSIADLGSLSIFFTGGEPFLRKDIFDILKSTSDSGMSIYLSTNGTLLNEKILAQLKNLDIKLFQVSLDSLRPSIHDQIRGVKGVHEKAKKAVQLASNIIKKNVALGSVLMKDNHNEIHRLMELTSTLGADTFAFIMLLKYGRADESLDPTTHQKLTAIRKIFETYEYLKGKVKLASNTTLPPPMIPKDLRDNLWDKLCFCSFPYTLGVEADGGVAPCDGFLGLSEFIAGNIRKKSLAEIWKKSKVFRKVRSIEPGDFKGVCRKCRFREFCMGGCRAAAYLEFGDLRMPDPFCQKVYELNLFPKECLE